MNFGPFRNYSAFYDFCVALHVSSASSFKEAVNARKKAILAHNRASASNNSSDFSLWLTAYEEASLREIQAQQAQKIEDDFLHSLGEDARNDALRLCSIIDADC